jgi:hypothetical protein
MEALDRGHNEPPQEGEIARTFEGESQRLQPIENKWFPRIKWKRIRVMRHPMQRDLHSCKTEYQKDIPQGSFRVSIVS